MLERDGISTDCRLREKADVTVKHQWSKHKDSQWQIKLTNAATPESWLMGGVDI